MTPKIFAGSANEPLAEAVAARFDLHLGSREVHVFPDGELQAELRESVRGEEPADGSRSELGSSPACSRAAGYSSAL